jgi:hypothetical protein
MNGLKSMKQAMKQVTNAEMNDFPPRRPIIRYVSFEPPRGGEIRPVCRWKVARSSAVIVRPKIALRTASQLVQVSSFLKRGSDPKSFGLLMASMMVGWCFTALGSSLGSVTTVTTIENQ